MNKVLFDKNPIVIDTVLASKIGLNEAIVLQQIHYWVEINKAKKSNFYEGDYWTYNTIKDWNKCFPFYAERTIQRIFKKLKDLGVLKVGNFNKTKYDKTSWYTIDYDVLYEIVEENQETKSPSRQNDVIEDAKMDESMHQNDVIEDAKMDESMHQNGVKEHDKMTEPIPEINTENTTEINSKTSSSSKMEEAVVNNKDVIQFFEDNFYLLKRFDLEVISSWCERYDKALIIEAMKTARMKNIRNLTYIERTLIDWEQEGICTPEAVKIYLSSKEKRGRDGGNQPNTFKHQGGTAGTQDEDDVTRALRKAGKDIKFEDDEEYDY